MNLNGILIGSEDPKRLTEYYTKVFGKPAMEDSPHSEVKGRNTQPGRILLNIESSDVKGDFAKLTSAGAKVVREPYRMDDWPPNTWVATLADPDDNYFQLVSPM
jgi:predicted enzyme related to lactoylglutathione lyase